MDQHSFLSKPNLSQSPLNPKSSVLNTSHKPEISSGHKYERLHQGTNIKGSRGYEEDLKLILHSRDGSTEIAELNRRLAQHKIPRFNPGNKSEITEAILHARFSSGVTSDNIVREHEEHSAVEDRKHFLKEQELRKKEGYQAAMKHKILAEFFDYLKGKKK